MKIKFLKGGTIVPPYAIYEPQGQSTNSSAPKASKDKEDKDDFDSYKVLEGLIGKALPGDLNYAYSQISNLFKHIKLKQLFDDTADITGEYMTIVKIINDLTMHKELYDAAYTKATQNSTLGESVVNSLGQVMVTDGESFKWVTPEQYVVNKDLYRPITNAELFDYRFNGEGGLALNINTINTLAGSTSMKLIREKITNTLQSLGTTTESAEGGELMKSLKSYIKAADAVGSFDRKAIENAKLLKSELLAQADQAMKFIFNELTDAELGLLKMNSDGTSIGAVKLVLGLVSSKLSDKTELSLLDLKNSTNSGSSLLGVPERKATFASKVQAGDGGERVTLELNPESNIRAKYDVDLYSMVYNLKGEPIYSTSVDAMLKESGLMSIASVDGIYFGDVKLAQSQLQDLLYDGGAIARAELPVDDYGKPVSLRLINLVYKLNIELQLSTDKLSVLDKPEYKDLKKYFDKAGNPIKEYWKPFILINATTTEDLIQINPDNHTESLVDLGSDDVKYAKLKRILGTVNESTSERYTGIDDPNIFEEIFGGYDHLVGGLLFIPINMNIEAATLSDVDRQDINDRYYEGLYQNSL